MFSDIEKKILFLQTKKNTIMKNNLLVLCAMILAVRGIALGQPQVVEIPGLQADYSIVRYWQDDFSVAYSWDAGGTNCFILIEHNSPIVKRIDIPAGVKVNDFRIMHDSVYLGGHVVVSGRNRGLLACFSLADVISGSGNFNYMVTDYSRLTDFVGTPAPQNLVTDVKRIAVYEHYGRVNVAYIADNYVNCDPVRVGYGWAAFDMTTNCWNSHLMYNKHGSEVYTDIITTDNHVVAVGKVVATQKLVMRAYKQTDYTYPTYDPSGLMYLYPMVGQYMLDAKMISPGVATATTGEGFAVAYNYRANAVDSGFTVRTFTASGATVSVDDVFLSSAPVNAGRLWRMREACYTPLTNNIMVLNDYECPSSGMLESYVFHLTYPLTSNSFTGQFIPFEELHSIAPTPWSNGGFEFSGRNGASALFSYGFGQLGNYGSCYTRDDFWGEYQIRRTSDDMMPTNTIPIDHIDGISPFTVQTEKITILCEN